MKLFSRITTTLLVVAASLAGFSSCTKEESHDVRPVIRKGVPISFVVDDIKPIETKSVLTGDDIETKVTCVTLAAYSVSTGDLIIKEHFTSALGNMALDLAGETKATIYALANMGDMKSAFPANVSGISGINYVIPSYTGAAESIETRGIPMSGKLDYDADASTGTVIPIRRLLAKVAVDLTVDWPGTISTVQIKNMNKKLTPFGESKAVSASDVFSEEIESGGDLSSGTFVFFIPENRQGTIGSATTSAGKNNTDAAIDAKKDVLTYMEVLVNGTGRYSGTMTYRSYLGKNNTNDFDIVGNYRYTWTVVYKEDGTSIDDWKHENELSWNEWRYSMSTHYSNWAMKTLDGYIGDSFTAYLFCLADKYEKGIKKQSNIAYPIEDSNVTWTTEDINPANAFVYDYTNTSGASSGKIYRTYIGNVVGDGYIRATIIDEMGTHTDRVLFSCLGPKPNLILSVTPSSIKLGNHDKFHFTLVTRDTDGDWDCRDDCRYFLREGRFGYNSYDGTDITGDYYNHYIATDGTWEPTEVGTYVMYAQSDKYSPYYLDSNFITFTVTAADEASYNLTIEPVAPASKVVGETINLTAYLNKFINGSRTDHDDVSSDFNTTWTCGNPAVTIIDGNVTSTVPGTFTIYADYDNSGNGGGTLSASVNVTFTGDTKYITLDADPKTLKVGDNSTAIVKFFGTGTNVTSSSTIKAYTTESGTTESSIVTISGGTVTGVATGECYLEATYSTGGKTYVSNRVKITVSAADYITLDADPKTLKVGDNSTAIVKFFGTGTNVTSSSTIKAYTTESGATESSIVTISGGTITGTATGDCWLEATYSTGGKTYTSNRVKITVSADPITIIWASDSQPTYVAQRGKVSVGGLQPGETIASVEPTTSGVVRTVTSSGGTFYVECLRAGSYTLRVTTSKGRTADLPGTVVAPKLVLSQTTLYANPDGTVAHTGTDGLTGNSLRVTYETIGAGGTPVGATFSVVTTDVAIGGKLHQGLFSELLAPQPSSTASILTFDVGSVNSSGITALDTYANDVYEYTGSNGSSAPAIATVTVAPKEVSTGVDQKTFTVKKVNPFVNWSATAKTQPDEDDYGLVNEYRIYKTHTYATRSVSLYETLAGTRTSGGFTILNSGIEVFLNSAPAPSAISGVFSLASNTVSYTFSESASPA